MGFWTAYRASLKPPEIEEPVDRLLHRPLAYVVARAAFPLPISADQVTVGSILVGLTGAGLMHTSFRGHQLAAAACIFFATVLDCADGQLARMRGKSSLFGRMLDGTADMFVTGSVGLGAVYFCAMQGKSLAPNVWWMPWLMVALAIPALITTTWHTYYFDHFKNVWMRCTNPAYKDAEDAASARAAYEAAKHEPKPLYRAFAWRTYVFYVETQEQLFRVFDPFTRPLGQIPPYSPENEAIYRKYATRPWTALRRYYGVGSLMIGLTLTVATDMYLPYLVFRGVILNFYLFFFIRGWQREASKKAFAEMEALAGTGANASES
jgi:phosphatidylglycerophosphate synthase